MEAKKMGQFIREQRIKANLTQGDLANKLSVTNQAISKWENGRGIPDIEMLDGLSKIFNVDIEEILNGEIKEKQEEPPIRFLLFKKKRNIYIIIGLIILLILIIILLLPDNSNDNFNFQSLTSNNSCFGVKGVIAFNKNKKSIYISEIECSNEQKKEYLDIECILYENIGNMDKKIYEFGKIKDYESYNKDNLKTLNELLKNIEFNIDDYTCSCNTDSCDNLYIRINALNIDNEVITYNIPIELDNKCIN